MIAAFGCHFASGVMTACTSMALGLAKRATCCKKTLRIETDFRNIDFSGGHMQLKPRLNMIKSAIDAIIYFRHSPEEVAELERALVPMAEHLKAVAWPPLRARIRAILRSEDFRYKEAQQMRDACLRASKHARANLAEFFPAMRSEVLINAQILENAANSYWEAFREAQAVSVAVL
jgi:hypothetical protein